MVWHDLIGQLGTLTINEVALPLGERRSSCGVADDDAGVRLPQAAYGKLNSCSAANAMLTTVVIVQISPVYCLGARQG